LKLIYILLQDISGDIYIVSEKQTVFYKKKVTMHGSCNCQWVNRFLNRLIIASWPHNQLPQKSVRLHAPVHVTGTYYGYADGIWRRHSSARSISRERAVIESCYRLTKDNLTFEGYVRNITKDASDTYKLWGYNLF